MQAYCPKYIGVAMPNYVLEGDSYFVLQKLDSLIEGKKISINPEKIESFSLISDYDYYIFFDPEKERIENLKSGPFILCFLDKNLDQRLDYIKNLKNKATLMTFDPIPSTDTSSLFALFPEIKKYDNLPTKKCQLKYKNTKQNYEWFDLCLIDDLYKFGADIFPQIFEGYFDIWKFTDSLWSGKSDCLNHLSFINEKNFEDYFNRIRETSKDYIEVIQSGAKNHYEHQRLISRPIVANSFRFDKIQEKLRRINDPLSCISLFDECLKNVRLGSNPKIELIKLFIRFKSNVKQ